MRRIFLVMRPLRGKGGGRGAAVASLLVLAGCSRLEGNPDSYLIRDSAGVRIVDNVQPSWGPGQGWFVEDVPSLVVGGGSEGDGPPLFAVAGVVRMDDGVIVVATSWRAQLHFFGPSGQYLRSVGGRGVGPGEFSFLASISLYGDSLLAFDQRLFRVSVFDREGRFARSYDLPLAGRSFSVEGRFQHDGTALFRIRGYANRTPGYFRTNDPLVMVRPRDEVVRGIGESPGAEQYFWPAPLDNVRSGWAFSRSTSLALGNDLVYVGTADLFEIQALALDGELRRIIRAPGANRVVTPEDIERFEAEALRNRRRVRRGAPGLERLLEETEHHATMPAYSVLFLDSPGNLWVEEYRPPWGRGGENLDGLRPEWSLVGRGPNPPDAVPAPGLAVDQPCG